MSDKSTKGIYTVTIEIPKDSKNKYEIDHTTGKIHLDRVLHTPFVYPVNYGFFENTLAQDQDPLDALVLCEYPLFPGVVLQVRPVGVLNMEDDGGEDHKVLAVANADPKFMEIKDLEDVDKSTLEQIKHFFEHYKDLEPGKWAKIKEWQGAAEAIALVERSRI